MRNFQVENRTQSVADFLRSHSLDLFRGHRQGFTELLDKFYCLFCALDKRCKGIPYVREITFTRSTANEEINICRDFPP